MKNQLLRLLDKRYYFGVAICLIAIVMAIAIAGCNLPDEPPIPSLSPPGNVVTTETIITETIVTEDIEVETIETETIITND